MHDGMWHVAWMWIFWVLIIAAFRADRDMRGNRSESPEVVLKRRYARGEIDKDGYEQLLSEILG